MDTRRYLYRIQHWLENKTRRTTYRRRARVFCVGTAKSGTHSIDTMFDAPVRSLHEPSDGELLDLILEDRRQGLPRETIDRFVRDRVDYLCLDIDSSQLNFYILESLLRQFPDARFLLPIRSPEKWLRSLIDDSLRRTTTDRWQAFRDLRFAHPNHSSHPAAEAPLRDHGLYTLDGYLSYWRWHNARVLDLVPADRLMVFRTEEIGVRAEQISRFCGIDTRHLNRDRTHAFENKQRFGVLEQIDDAYLAEKIAQYFDPRVRAALDSSSAAPAAAPA